jgi:hypothetical protein
VEEWSGRLQLSSTADSTKRIAAKVGTVSTFEAIHRPQEQH